VNNISFKKSKYLIFGGIYLWVICFHLKLER
jgi:hypothetical protein